MNVSTPYVTAVVTPCVAVSPAAPNTHAATPSRGPQPARFTGNAMASALGGAKGFLGKELTAKDVSYVEVDRWLGIFHEVVPKAQALKCNDCHGADANRLDWKALGYRGDPQKTGGRKLR